LNSLGLPALLAAIALILRYAVAKYRFHKKYKKPPVVPRWPIVGNILDFPNPGGM
jgi:hypothetical protein